jgi:hypothetical protein
LSKLSWRTWIKVCNAKCWHNSVNLRY